MKNKIIVPAMAAVILAGAGTGILTYANASKAADLSTTTTPTTVAAVTTTKATTDPVDAPDATTSTTAKQHAPIGGDGNISAINGTTIIMQEESDEGGASYTIDASSATVTSNGSASTISALKVGDKIFVKGTVNGSNVAATEVSIGHPGGPRGN